MLNARTNRRLGRKLQQITPEQQKRAGLMALMVAPCRTHNLLQRVPELCRKRGYFPDGEKGFTIVVMAVGAYIVGARGQRLPVPPAFLEHERWRALVATFGERPTAAQMVEALELDDLLKPG